MKRTTLLLKSLLLAVGLLAGVSSWADTQVLYGRAVTADVANGYTAWSSADIAEGAWEGSTFYAAINANGLIIYNQDGNHETSGTLSNASQVITNSSITAPAANSTLTYDIVWDNGSSYNHNDHYTYLSVGSGIQFRAYSQAQKGEIVIGSTTISIPNACSGGNKNRDGDVWTIHMVVNTGSNTVTALTVQGNKGTTKVDYTLDEAKSIGAATFTSLSLGWYRANYRPTFTTTLQSIKITEETSSVTYANYTVHFVDGDGATVKADETRQDAVGTTVNANSTDIEDFISDNFKYVYANDGGGVEVKSDGSAELTVVYNKYAKFNYTVNAIDADETILAELATGYVYADANSVTTRLPWYVLYNGTLYYQNSNSNTTSIVSDDQVVNITYASNTPNVVYYSEGESISGGIKIEVINSSNYAAARALSNVKFATLEPGKYQIYSRFIVGNGTSGATYCTNPFTIGETPLEHNVPAKTISTYTSEEFNITESTDLYVTFSGSSISGVDYVYVVKTGVPVTIGESGWATLYSPFALDFAKTELTAYTATVKPTDSSVELKEVSSVPANTGVVLKGAAGTYDIPVIPSSDTTDKGDLKGNVTAATTYDADYSRYYLAINNEGTEVQFKKLNEGGTIAAGKAYLEIPVPVVPGPNARTLNVVFAGETTAIDAIANVKEQNGEVYNLAGQRVAKPAKGLYIVSGKKVMFK